MARGGRLAQTSLMSWSPFTIAVVFAVVSAAGFIFLVERRHTIEPIVERWYWLVEAASAFLLANIAFESFEQGVTAFGLVMAGRGSIIPLVGAFRISQGMESERFIVFRLVRAC